MIVKQICVFLENRKGRLAELTHLLGENKINIRAISLADTSDFGIVRLIVNDTEKAYQVLKKAELTATINDVIAVEVADKPGGLASVLAILQSEGKNVEYLYGFLERKTDKAIMIFRFDDMDAAVNVLKEHGVSLLSDQELRDL
ncbi:MAG: ACT domain-containing protein [Deltaproteobacteria bacterium]|nr:ACT domain-containing protein [Deltaproteobacteria bacterium]